MIFDEFSNLRYRYKFAAAQMPYHTRGNFLHCHSNRLDLGMERTKPHEDKWVVVHMIKKVNTK